MTYKSRDLAGELGLPPDDLELSDPIVPHREASEEPPGKCSVCWQAEAVPGLFRMCVQCFNLNSEREAYRLSMDSAKGKV